MQCSCGLLQPTGNTASIMNGHNISNDFHRITQILQNIQIVAVFQLDIEIFRTIASFIKNFFRTFFIDFNIIIKLIFIKK